MSNWHVPDAAARRRYESDLQQARALREAGVYVEDPANPLEPRFPVPESSGDSAHLPRLTANEDRPFVKCPGCQRMYRLESDEMPTHCPECATQWNRRDVMPNPSAERGLRERYEQIMRRRFGGPTF
jgi:hypothetical protein